MSKPHSRSTHIDHELTTFSSMLQRGLITQQEFDRQKDALFALPPDFHPAWYAASGTDKSESKEEALRLIDVARMCCLSLELTPTNLKFYGRDQVMKEVDRELKKVRDGIHAKGQPILATSATTGVGKSRLLEEVRRKYLQGGYHVVAVSYNTAAGLLPKEAEKNFNDLQGVEDAFLSRLLCMMLPKDEFESCHNLHTRFKVTDADVLDILQSKFSGANVLLLMDEVGALRGPNGEEGAVFKVIHLLGDLAHKLSSKLGPGKFCAALFTALSDGVIRRAATPSDRPIYPIALPLLSKDAVEAIVKSKYPDANDNVAEHVFSLSAGHSRTVEKFLNLEWGKDGPDRLTTLKGQFNELTRSPVGQPLTEEEIRAILVEEATDRVSFDELSRRSIVQVTGDRVIIVPAFLYEWASNNRRTSRLARHVWHCLLAAWESIFLSSGKQGSDGRAFKQFLWHYEAVRRELLGGETSVSITTFYRLTSISMRRWSRAKLRKFHETKFVFPCIRFDLKIPNPPRNKFEKFDVKRVCKDTGTRYEPQSSNFPLYDWFTVAVDNAGATVVKGEQAKHGSGDPQRADSNVISVKISTRNEKPQWEKNEWLVLGPDELHSYLGSTFAAVSACLRQLEPKRKRESEAGTVAKRKRTENR